MHEFHEDEGRHWPRVFGYILVAVTVAVAGVFLSRTIYRSIRHNSVQPHTAITTKQPVKKPAAKTQKTQTVASAANNSTPTELPNNGPGNVAGLFTASTLAAGGLHYVLKRRRGV